MTSYLNLEMHRAQYQTSQPVQRMEVCKERTEGSLEREQSGVSASKAMGGGDEESGKAGTSAQEFARLSVAALERSKKEAAKRGKLVKDLRKVEAGWC